jgi:putative FmdB family regulatory protein
MPLYEYTCARCDHRFEALQALGASSDGVECPQCRHEGVTKVFSTFSGRVGAATKASADPGCGQPQCCRLDGGQCN